MEQWFFGPTVSAPAAASGDTLLITVPEDQIFRLFGVSAFTVAGGQPSVQLVVSRLALAQGVTLRLDGLPAVGGGSRALIDYPIVIPPRASLRISHFIGDVNTIISVSAYGALSPIGSAFSC